ncbi:hypothetical protein ACFWOL_15435 [Streptomyces sp. NPDC058442]|uniref:hypothetical protein n=1 Tax=Streptomyces sp. NPDC058442 TaxID=3346503 RepID=UPI003661523F
MIAEAIDTAITLGWALAAWLAVLSLAAALALHAVIAIVWWTVRALWRGLGGPSWARSRWQARRIARATRPDYEEVA